MKTFLTILIFFIFLQGYSQGIKKGPIVRLFIKDKEYYENGNIKEKGRKKHQFTQNFVGNGSRTHCGFFKQGKWVEFYPSGKKKRVVLYDGGIIIKEIKSWDEK